ncbi:hypothetical protein C8R46DRAFT_1056236, partial [Mycena filopes]
MSSLRLTDLGQDVLLNICAEIFEDNPRERVTLTWRGESRMESEPPKIFPGPPSELLLDLAPMHSQLAAATRPYIWREVLIAYGSYDATERGLTRLERAQRPHIAPYVQALFLSFNFIGDQDEYIPEMVTMISNFTALRAVCLGTFQSYRQPRMYAPLATAIRTHPHIDTLMVWHMTHSSELIAEGNSRPYHIHLQYCHSGSAAVLAKPKCLTSLSHQNEEPQNLEDHLPAFVWDTLKYLAPGHPDVEEEADHKFLQESLLRYIKSGRTPALRTLDLSSLPTYAERRPDWLQLGKQLPQLRSFKYASRSSSTVDEATAMLKAFSHVRCLHIVVPSRASEFYDEDSDDEDEEFDLNPIFLALLSKMPLEHLVLDIWHSPVEFLVDEGVLEEFAEVWVKQLAELCKALETVRMRYHWEDMEGDEEPVVVEYKIKRSGSNGPMLEAVTPRVLAGTLLEFLD